MLNELKEKILLCNDNDLNIPDGSKSLSRQYNSNVEKLLFLRTMLLKGLKIIENFTFHTNDTRVFEAAGPEWIEHYNNFSKYSQSKIVTNEFKEVDEFISQSLREFNSFFNNCLDNSGTLSLSLALAKLMPFKKENESVELHESLIIDARKTLKEVKSAQEIVSLQAQKSVLQVYATTYKDQEDIHTKSSSKWLKIGTSIFLLFLLLLCASISFKWFPTTIILTNTNDGIKSTQEILNYPVLVSKGIMVSLFLYFIGLSFKQYAINKHLQIINQNKKNAFDSFILFEKAIGAGDTESKNALLSQLAKSIYETSNTGYLNIKNSDTPTLFETTNILKNKD